MSTDYRPFGVPVHVSVEESQLGVSKTTADGSLLDAEGHYLTGDESEDI